MNVLTKDFNIVSKCHNNKCDKNKEGNDLHWFVDFNVNFGNFCANNIPAMSGNTKIRKTDLAILKKSNPNINNGIGCFRE